MTNQRGISVLEVIIVIGMLAIIITGVGAALNSNHRLTTAAEAKAVALGYARQALEIMTLIQNEAFGCTGGANGICNGQPCVPRPGYTSCWTEFANTLGTNGPLRLVDSGTGWQLAEGTETIDAERTYQRRIDISNQRRTGDGALVASGGDIDFNTKEIVVTVSWDEAASPRNVTLSTLLTAWKN